MKVLFINTLYPKYIDYFLAHTSIREDDSFQVLSDKVNNDFFGWNNAFEQPFQELGIDYRQIFSNFEILQKRWAAENQVKPSANWFYEIVEQQIEHFKPDIVLFTNMSRFPSKIIKEYKKSFKFVKLFISHICSPSYNLEQIKEYDIFLVCLNSTRQTISQAGGNAYYFAHGFNPSILKHIPVDAERHNRVCFTGDFSRVANGHGLREQYLTAIVDRHYPIDIYSEAYKLESNKDTFDFIARRGLYSGMSLLKKIGLPERHLLKIPYVGVAASWKNMPENLMPLRFRKALLPPVYGLDMYKKVSSYAINFNIHIDYAGSEAANVRLFEATGLGSCLLTDWKSNLHEFFEDGKEIVTYKNMEECAEKLTWLLEHSATCQTIGQNAQLKTTSVHAYSQRANQLADIINHEIS